MQRKNAPNCIGILFSIGKDRHSKIIVKEDVIWLRQVATNATRIPASSFFIALDI